MKLLTMQKTGKTSTFDSNFSRWESWLVSYYRNKGIGSHDIEDLVQVVLIKIHTGIEQIEAAKRDAWIASVARNALTDFFRSKGKNKTVSSDTLGPEDNLSSYQLPVSTQTTETPEDHMNEKEEAQKIKEALSNLSEMHYQIVDMFYFQDMSQEQIAKKLGIPKGTVKSRLFAALQKLKAII
jgi:RNA polymerase sigma factor (sigma-70 family)